MTSQTQTGVLPNPLAEQAREIVKGDDPKALDMAMRLLELDRDELIETRGVAQRVIEQERQMFLDAIAEPTLIDQIAGVILLRDILAAGGTAIAHDRYVVEIKKQKVIEKRIDVLRQLEGKVPDDELRKALYLTNPQPEWKADAAVLSRLLRKYGPESEIGKIIREGLVETYGQPVLVFKQREQIQNVTPTERAL